MDPTWDGRTGRETPQACDEGSQDQAERHGNGAETGWLERRPAVDFRNRLALAKPSPGGPIQVDPGQEEQSEGENNWNHGWTTRNCIQDAFVPDRQLSGMLRRLAKCGNPWRCARIIKTWMEKPCSALHATSLCLLQ